MRKLPGYIRAPQPTSERSLRHIYGGRKSKAEIAADAIIITAKAVVTALGCLGAWGLIVIVDRVLIFAETL